MRTRDLYCLALAIGLAALPPPAFHGQSGTDPYLTAHEWGTFTSIVGSDGHGIVWLPLTGSTDLPSFVEHFAGVSFKGGLLGTVRMETPVLYFYTNRATTLSVHVSFAKGLITEWYPQASKVFPIAAVAPKYANFSDWSLYQKHPDGSIDWNLVELEPHSSAEFPREALANHYYAARETSATPLKVNTARGVQTEKFLFYRGVSTFAVPLGTRIRDDGSVRVENLSSDAIPAMLLFERHGERLGFHVVQQPASPLQLNPPELNGDIYSLKQTMVGMLVAQGLYEDEAQAMFETWRDSWFEEGSRLLYIVPRSFVDSVLPLMIHPVPSETVRVFVGRLELITPATKAAVEQALENHDTTRLASYGRFLEPIAETLIGESEDPSRTLELQESLSTYYALRPSRK